MVAVIVIASALYLPLRSASTTQSTKHAISTTTSGSNYPMTATTTNTTAGSNFALLLNSTQFNEGETINITAIVTNSLASFNNLSLKYDWPEPWLGPGGGTIDTCGSFASAVIFQGYYTQSNVSILQSGAELQLAKPIFPPPECPYTPGPWSSYFPFQPHESQVGFQYSTSGDYGNASSQSSTFQLFNGVYTVVGGDEWGQMVILHFSVTPSIQTTTSTSCTISGQPAGMFLRMLSNSTLTPIAGAKVAATNQPALCNNSPATQQSTMKFTTNSTEWYSFPSENDAGYSFAVSYLNQNYSFTANLSPVSVTCATLYLPSGRTNITTIEFQSSCQSVANSTTTEVSNIYTTIKTTVSCANVTTTVNDTTEKYAKCQISAYTTVVTMPTTNISCPDNQQNGIDPQDAPALALQENSTAYLCVRFYYYNPNSTMSIDTSNIFGIAGYRPYNTSFSTGFDASPNFTISTYPEELTLGGPQNLNEGVSVLYVIHANPNSSGTYNFGFQATIYPNFENCNGFSDIVVGDGSPNYNVGFGSCTASLTNPRNSQGFINGILFVEVVGMTNSTS
jgi:hypothetical protein